MEDIRKQITLTVVENAMIDLDNTEQEKYTFNEEQFGLLIDSLVEKFDLCGVGSSAWYCEISTINGQWFEIVTGKNEMDVCIKIEKSFGKETKYQLIDKYELM